MPIGQELMLDSRGAQARGHRREPVALLDAQLLGTAHQRSRRARRRLR